MPRREWRHSDNVGTIATLDFQERQGPYEDVKPTLRILDKMGLKLGVLSQNRMTGSQLKEDLETRLIAGYFSAVLTSEDIGYDKPDPRFFEIGSNMMRLKKSELWYVGNRYHEDVVGARNAGITPVLVERGRRHRSRDCLAVTGLLALPPMLKGRSLLFRLESFIHGSPFERGISESRMYQRTSDQPIPTNRGAQKPWLSCEADGRLKPIILGKCISSTQRYNTW